MVIGTVGLSGPGVEQGAQRLGLVPCRVLGDALGQEAERLADPGARSDPQVLHHLATAEGQPGAALRDLLGALRAVEGPAQLIEAAPRRPFGELRLA